MSNLRTVRVCARFFCYPRVAPVIVLLLLVAPWTISRTFAEAPPAPTPEALEFFETHIRPVLAERCFECHSAQSKVLQGGLRLDTAERLRTGGETGAIVVPHQPDQSVLIKAIRYESYEMPPSGKLPDNVIEDFVKWVSMGAPDPRNETAADPQAPVIDPYAHWAYQRPKPSPPPSVADESRVRGDIDRFILAKLDAAGLKPSAQANPRALLRRVYYDLTGLPPTAEELTHFAADPSDANYEAIVDRLLASPRFGERWARYWLDLARYADTKGYVFTEDRNYKQAYTYRDWVIASFNTDRSYDKFVIAQLAADQVDDPACAPATGFMTLGRRFLNNQADIINDRIDVMSRSLLGLTVACARCHDHKFDPISTADYYSLYGVFASSKEDAREDTPPFLTDREQPVNSYVFIRGNAGNRGPEVTRHFLTCLTADHQPQEFKKGSGRRELADAIASRDNPLTARVWVNRVWGHLFGAGLVSTPSDYGTRGEPPSHPELLDTMACQFMDDAWSTKRLIRRIMLSSTYRQASDDRPECVAVDAQNQLLWRANRRRLDLESLRDSLVNVTGRLDETVGGPSVQLTTPPFSNRRAVYGFIERQNLPAFFRTFDFANPSNSTGERAQTVSSQQALFLMNSPFVLQQAIELAARSEQADDNKPVAEISRVARLFQFALGRVPTETEIADALEFVNSGVAADNAVVASRSPWEFGWGAFDETTTKVSFQPFSHFVNNTWQMGEKLPDPTHGYLMLNAGGGHPGDPAHQTIRRWVAPAAGQLHIEGVLAHATEGGDGIRGRIVSSRHGLAGSWDALKNEVKTAPAVVAVQPGDTIDFITDSRANSSFDTYNWSITLRLQSSAEDSGRIWDSVTEFHGPVAPNGEPLSRWQQLAQVLLMSNEFAFVD